MSASSPYVRFYLGERVNGRTIHDVHAFGRDYVDLGLDYWLFPSMMPSKDLLPRQLAARPLTLAEARLLRQNLTIAGNFVKSYRLFLDFLGRRLENEQSGAVQLDPSGGRGLNQRQLALPRLRLVCQSLSAMGFWYFVPPLLKSLPKDIAALFAAFNDEARFSLVTGVSATDWEDSVWFQRAANHDAAGAEANRRPTSATRPPAPGTAGGLSLPPLAAKDAGKTTPYSDHVANLGNHRDAGAKRSTPPDTPGDQQQKVGARPRLAEADAHLVASGPSGHRATAPAALGGAESSPGLLERSVGQAIRESEEARVNAWIQAKREAVKAEEQRQIEAEREAARRAEDQRRREAEREEARLKAEEQRRLEAKREDEQTRAKGKAKREAEQARSEAERQRRLEAPLGVKPFLTIPIGDGTSHLTSRSAPLLVLSQGSVVDFRGDAIVNAANTGCIDGGGVDGAINDAGGEELRRARRALPVIGRGGTRCPEGEAVVTTAGALSVKNVVHAVGPNYCGARRRSEVEACDLKLRGAYRAAMRRAQQVRARTVGFSLLSAGIFRGSQPLQAVLEIGVEEVMAGAYTGLQQVHLVAFSAAEKEALAAAASAVEDRRLRRDSPADV